MIWKIRRRDLDLTHRAALMGILNVTPDSFSDGGCFTDPGVACEHALRMCEEGADIIDIGGESTRPGAIPVPAEEELRRVLPVIRRLRSQSPVLISIDTSKASVARAALDEGADIINDITALRGDPDMPETARAADAAVVLMHMQGTPQTMQQNPSYRDVVGEVGEFLRQRLQAAVAWGLNPERMVVDPGIGFGKTPEHSRALLATTSKLAALGRPLLIGVSRKSFLGWVAGSSKIEDRLWPGVAVTSFCREQGARIFRVHDVRAHRDALRMTEAILSAGKEVVPA